MPAAPLFMICTSTSQTVAPEDARLLPDDRRHPGVDRGRPDGQVDQLLRRPHSAGRQDALPPRNRPEIRADSPWPDSVVRGVCASCRQGRVSDEAEEMSRWR